VCVCVVQEVTLTVRKSLSVDMSLLCACVYALTFMSLRGQIHARTWCCEVVGSCEV